MLQLPTALIAKICCKISKKFSYMQKKHHIFAFFFKNICVCQKKAVLLHPLSRKKAIFYLGAIV